MHKYYIIIKGINGKLYAVKYADTTKVLNSIVKVHSDKGYQCIVVRRFVLLVGDNLTEERRLAVDLGILDM